MNDLEQDLLISQAEVNHLREESASLREQILFLKQLVKAFEIVLGICTKILKEKGK